MPAISEPSATPEPPSIRERYRAQVRGEVKEIALAQLAQAGPAGLSISAIGKQLGVSGPALYRYFASRDDLLTELVIDAYQDLADALTAAASQVPDVAGQGPSRDSRARLEAVARAYRAWALAQPHRYRLLFGPPLPGYDAHAARLVDAAQAAMNCLLGILREPGKGDPGVGGPGEGSPGEGAPRDGAATPRLPLPQPLASQLVAWAEPYAPGTDPATALSAVLIWSRMHGIVSLEIAGNFASMGIDPGQLFEVELARLPS